MNLAHTVALTFALFSSSAIGQIQYNESVDEFTGENNSVVMITGSNNKLFLGWRCLSDRLVVILGHKYMGGDSDDDVYVRTKFDDDEPSGTKYYQLAANNRMTMFDRTDVSLFTKQSIAANQVMIRVTDPLDNGSVTGTFTTEGLETALKKLPCYP